MLKTVSLTTKVGKYGKYGQYHNNGVMYCCLCRAQVDHSQEDSLTKHVFTDLHDSACFKHIRAGAKFPLASGYKKRE